MSLIEMQTSPIRLVGVARGDPNHPATASGIARSLFDALGRRYHLVSRVAVGLRRWQRPLVVLASAHPSRQQWRERYYKHVLAFELCSRNSRAVLSGLGEQFDVAVQVFSLFQTRGAPYVLYLDNTHQLSLEHWPGWSPLGLQNRKAWLARERQTYQEALHLFVTGQPVADSLVSFYGVPPARVTVVGGGANFDPLPTFGERSWSPTVLFVGRDFRRKGGDVLVEAFSYVRRRYADARLLIIGTTEAPSAPGIEVLGRVEHGDQLANIYRQASIFCLPSRFDPFAMVLMEAMAFGLPCIATPVGALSEIVVPGETGLLVPPGDPRALADALLRLLDNPAEAARLGANGRSRVENVLNWDKVVDRMAPVMDRLAPALRAGNGSRVGRVPTPRHASSGVRDPAEGWT